MIDVEVGQTVIALSVGVIQDPLPAIEIAGANGFAGSNRLACAMFRRISRFDPCVPV
jgi:hypothetical protein